MMAVATTLSVARQHGATVITLGRNPAPASPQRRSSGGKGEYSFTDSDCAAARLAGTDHCAIGRQRCRCDRRLCRTGSWTFLTGLQDQVLHSRQRSLPEGIESTITSNFACKRSAFLAVGGFPLYARKRDPVKPIWGNEDEELGFLLTRNGDRIRWVPDAGVYHAYRGSLLGFLRQQKFYAERIVMSHFRFPEMAEARSNYSRSSGAIHLGATLALGQALFADGCALCPPCATVVRPFLRHFGDSVLLCPFRF